MTTATKCRAKDPMACTDPNCPEKKAAREAFSAFYNTQTGHAPKKGKVVDNRWVSGTRVRFYDGYGTTAYGNITEVGVSSRTNKLIVKVHWDASSLDGTKWWDPEESKFLDLPS